MCKISCTNSNILEEVLMADNLVSLSSFTQCFIDKLCRAILTDSNKYKNPDYHNKSMQQRDCMFVHKVTVQLTLCGTPV